MASGFFPVEPAFSETIRQIQQLSGRRRLRLINKLSDVAELIIARSKTEYLTNARAKGGLNVVTGRLRSSISKSEVMSTGNTLFIWVGTNVFYGAIWELGWESASTGRFHQRKFLEPAIDDLRPRTTTMIEQAGGLSWL